MTRHLALGGPDLRQIALNLRLRRGLAIVGHGTVHRTAMGSGYHFVRGEQQYLFLTQEALLLINPDYSTLVRDDELRPEASQGCPNFP